MSPITRGLGLTHRIDQAEDKLTRMDIYLLVNPNHPKRETRDDQFIRELRDLEAMYDQRQECEEALIRG